MIICVHVNGKILKYATLIDPLLVKSYRVHPDVHVHVYIVQINTIFWAVGDNISSTYIRTVTDFPGNIGWQNSPISVTAFPRPWCRIRCWRMNKWMEGRLLVLINELKSCHQYFFWKKNMQHLKLFRENMSILYIMKK